MKIRLRPNLLASPAALLLLSSLAQGADYPTTVLSFNPAGYWRLGETASVPAANIAVNAGSLGATGNGYIVLDVTNSEPGVVGTSYRFSNPGPVIGHCGSKVDVPQNAALNPNGAFTVEFWAKPASLNDNTAGVCPVASMNPDFTVDANNRSGWLFYQRGSPNNWQFRVGDEHNSYTRTISGGTPQAGVWQHIAGVYDGSTVTLYVDGQPVAGPSSVPSFNPNRFRTLRIGGTLFNGDLDGSLTDGNRGFDGWLDEVAVYASALSGSTIAAHFDAATTNNAGYAAQILAENPVGYWHLDETPYTPPNPSSLPSAANSGTSGASANGIYNPGATTGVAGPPFSGMGVDNKAAWLSGVVGNVSITNAVGLNFADQITLAAWVKPAHADVYPVVRDIISHGDPASSEVFLRVNSGYYEVGSWDGTSQSLASAPMPEGDAGNWVFLAGTWDGANWNLYRYDNLIASDVFSTGSIVIDAPWSIGSLGDPSANGSFFGGGVAEAAIFTNALSAAQLKQIFYSANVLPIITQAPQAPSGTVYEGTSLTFTVAAEGNKPLTYQWTKNGANLAGQNGTSLSLPNVTTNDSGTYAIIVSNPIGSVTNSFVLTVVTGPPLIFAQPQGGTRYVGATIRFSVVAGGSPPLSYQWKFNETNDIAGATSSTYVLNNVQLADAGTYSCTLVNPYGSSNTVSVALSVLPAPTGYGAVVLSDNPSWYWRLGETNGSVAHDYWGGQDGQYHNATLGVPGFSFLDPDTAVSFGAVNSYVGDISGRAIDFSGTSAEFSLEIWANGPPNQVDGAALICKGTGAGGEQFSMDVTGGNYRFYVWPPSGAAVECKADVGPDGTWQHVVGVYDQAGGAMHIYVNGAEHGTATPPAAGPLSTPHPVSIGSRRGGVDPNYDLYFTGTLDEAAIYSKALTADRVEAHFSAQYGNNTRPFIAVQPTSVTNYVTLPATLSVGAAGTQPLSYQWKQNGVDVPGATESKLVFDALELTNAGNYSVVVANSIGTTNSAVAVLTVLPAPTAPLPTPDLVLHLKFDNNLVDDTGRGNDGTKVGGTTFVNDGQLGSALHYFTDTSIPSYNYVTLGVRPDLQFSSNVNFSVSYWIRLPLNYDKGDLPFFCNAVNSTFSPGYTFAPTYGPNASSPNSPGNVAGGWAWSLNGNGVYGVANSINDAAWHHLAHTFDRNGNGNTYLDGVLVDSRSVVGDGNLDTGKATNIGQDPTGKYGESGEADIDDLGVWRRALTQFEVSGIYVAGFVNHVSFTGVATPPSLSISRSGANIVITFEGRLESSATVTGPYTTVPGNPSSPYTTPASEAAQFYRSVR